MDKDLALGVISMKDVVHAGGKLYIPLEKIHTSVSTKNDGKGKHFLALLGRKVCKVALPLQDEIRSFSREMSVESGSLELAFGLPDNTEIWIDPASSLGVNYKPTITGSVCATIHLLSTRFVYLQRREFVGDNCIRFTETGELTVLLPYILNLLGFVQRFVINPPLKHAALVRIT